MRILVRQLDDIVVCLKYTWSYWVQPLSFVQLVFQRHRTPLTKRLGCSTIKNLDFSLPFLVKRIYFKNTDQRLNVRISSDKTNMKQSKTWYSNVVVYSGQCWRSYTWPVHRYDIDFNWKKQACHLNIYSRLKNPIWREADQLTIKNLTEELNWGQK